MEHERKTLDDKATHGLAMHTMGAYPSKLLDGILGAITPPAFPPSDEDYERAHFDANNEPDRFDGGPI